MKIIGYHACKNHGGWSYIWENAPFLCDEDNPKKNRWQWLSRGYYFWTDDMYFAHKWGETAYDNQYSIMHCTITIDDERFLDLVGSTQDQIYFSNIIKLYQRKTKNKINPTVSAVISHFRNLKDKQKDDSIFPYDAIKAQDNYQEIECNFTPNRGEYINLITRQQLCVLDHSFHAIKKENISHPRRIQ